MFCGRCCVTEPRSRTALQLDIFIEIPSVRLLTTSILKITSTGVEWRPSLLELGITTERSAFTH